MISLVPRLLWFSTPTRGDQAEYKITYFVSLSVGVKVVSGIGVLVSFDGVGVTSSDWLSTHDVYNDVVGVLTLSTA